MTSKDELAGAVVAGHEATSSEVATALIKAIGEWSVGKISSKRLRQIGIAQAKTHIASIDKTVAVLENLENQ